MNIINQEALLAVAKIAKNFNFLQEINVYYVQKENNLHFYNYSGEEITSVSMGGRPFDYYASMKNLLVNNELYGMNGDVLIENSPFYTIKVLPELEIILNMYRFPTDKEVENQPKCSCTIFDKDGHKLFKIENLFSYHQVVMLNKESKLLFIEKYGSNDRLGSNEVWSVSGKQILSGNAHFEMLTDQDFQHLPVVIKKSWEKDLSVSLYFPDGQKIITLPHGIRWHGYSLVSDKILVVKETLWSFYSITQKKWLERNKYTSVSFADGKLTGIEENVFA